MSLNEIITMYKDAGNVIHIQNLINGAILMYRKHGVYHLMQYTDHVILPEYGVSASADLETLVMSLDPAIVSLSYVEGEE
mgnify:CR=1 FL=1